MRRKIRLTESGLHRTILESVIRVLREIKDGDFEDGWLESYRESDEFDQFHHLAPEISQLHQTYDPALDGEIEDYDGAFVNNEGEDDYEPVDRYWPSQEAQGFIDYANRVGDRSSRRKEDMDNDWRERDRVRNSAHNHWHRQLNAQHRARKG